MEVSLLFKIGAVGILVSVLCQILKHSQREELAFLTSLTGLRSEEHTSEPVTVNNLVCRLLLEKKKAM